MDQCTHCTAKGDLKTCINTKCNLHESWMVGELRKEIDRLDCNNIECHIGRDILASIYETMRQLPGNGVHAILCGAAQEIQAWRDQGK